MKTKEEIDKYYSNEKIECLLCGKIFKALGSHIATHDITVNEYKDKFNLPYSRSLVGMGTRAVLSKNMKSRIARGDVSLMPIERVAHLGQQKKNRFRDYTKFEMGRRIATHNIVDKSATMKQMNDFVLCLENKHLTVNSITGNEKKHGVITSSTFYRQIKKNPGLYSDLRQRVDENRLKVMSLRHSRRRQK